MMDVELSQEEEALLAADDRAADRFGYWMIAVCGLVLAAIAIPLLQGGVLAQDRQLAPTFVRGRLAVRWSRACSNLLGRLAADS